MNKYEPFIEHEDKYEVCCVCDQDKSITKALMDTQDKVHKMISHSYCEGHFAEAKKEVEEIKRRKLLTNQ